MTRKMLCILTGIILLAGVVWAGAFNYITAADLKRRIEQGPPMILVDIQPADQYAKGHLPGSIETNAFPAKTDEEKARLDQALPRINASTDDVVILCPRGKLGAENTFNYYKSKGVAEKRLLILENGMAGWPYPKASK